MNYVLGPGRPLTFHAASFGTYGSRRFLTDLQETAECIGHNTVAAIMAETRLQGVPKRRFRITTNSDYDESCKNILDRNFDPEAKNTCWAVNITCLRTKDGGWLYLAVIIDLFSSRVAATLNGRRLRTLDWKTPTELFNEQILSVP